MAQIKSGATADLLTVEAATKAARITARPIDYGSLGAYSKSLESGTMAAGLGASALVFSFRYSAANVCLVRSVRVGAGGILAFAAGFAKMDLVIARAFTASDTGGTAGTLSGNNGKRRTNMATTGVADIRISSTAALSAGTRTLDTDPIANLVSCTGATAGTVIIPAGSELVPDDRDCRYPIALAQNEGFIIRATVPATGTWTFGVTVDWEEVAAY